MLLETKEQLQDFATRLSEQTEFSFDTETVSLEDKTMRGCSFAWEGYSCAILFGEVTPEWFIGQVSDVFLDENRMVAIQNSKFDYRVLKRYGIEMKAKIFDTLIASFILNENKRTSRSLDVLAEEELGWPAWGEWTEDLHLDKAKFGAYAERDAQATWELKKLFEKRLKDEELWYAFRVDCAATPVLISMEDNGALIDKAYLEDTDRRITWDKFITEQKVYEVFGKFNMGSGKQLAEVLREKGVALPVKEGTGNPITAEWALLEVGKKYPVMSDILRMRRLTKIQSTYVRGILSRIDANNRLHTSFNIATVVTGRLSSSNPNLQNIPRPGEDEFRIRDAFIAPPGHVLIDIDESQLELRIMAHRSADPIMCKAFIDGADIHQVTADKLGISRQYAKNINFGLMYGLSAKSLSADLGIRRRDAEAILAGFFSTYIGIKKYMDRIIREARITGFVRTMSGRKRRLPELKSGDFGTKGHAERQCVNTAIQGSASDILKRAQIEIHKRLDPKECRMLIQVHDELIFECLEDKADKYLPMIKHHLEHPFDKPLRCPLLAEPKLVYKWGKAK